MIYLTILFGIAILSGLIYLIVHGKGLVDEYPIIKKKK